MRKAGLWVVLAGLAVHLVPTAYYALVNLGDLYTTMAGDTLSALTDVMSLLNLLGALLVIAGVLMVLFGKDPRAGHSTTSAAAWQPRHGPPSAPPPMPGGPRAGMGHRAPGR